MWPYNPDTKAKFAQKKKNRKGYTEGIDQIENTPEIAAVEGEGEGVVTTPVVVKKIEKAVVEKVETPKSTKRKAVEMEANVTPVRYDFYTMSVCLLSSFGFYE